VTLPAGELAELAAAAGRGDRDAFERLVEVTSPGVYALALRLVGNEHDASDVVQETYLRAYRSIGRFRGESAVTTWLYRIAANRSSTHLSRRSRTRCAPLDDEITVVDTRSELDPEAVVGASSDRAELVEALASLPGTLRAVVVLRDVYDLPHDAIAAELGISRAAAKVRLHRGRRRLRELLFVASGEQVAGSASEGRRTSERPRRAGEPAGRVTSTIDEQGGSRRARAV
jgi:RNA polymerase sigma-70 factor, ECF subfamily